MATTHVFIVDANTFKYHLEYMFAGTGAENQKVDFISTPNVTKHRGYPESSLTGMIADSQRVRIGDLVIFYLQQNLKQGIHEGKFYGVFKISSLSFLDDDDGCTVLIVVRFHDRTVFIFPGHVDLIGFSRSVKRRGHRRINAADFKTVLHLVILKKVFQILIRAVQRLFENPGFHVGSHILKPPDVNISNLVGPGKKISDEAFRRQL